MNVTFATNGLGVPQSASNGVDRGQYIPLTLSLGSKGLGCAQTLGCQHCPRPGPEILGGKCLAGDLVQVSVDIGGIDGVSLPGFVKVLEQFVAGQVATAFHDAGQPPISQVDD